VLLLCSASAPADRGTARVKLVILKRLQGMVHVPCMALLLQVLLLLLHAGSLLLGRHVWRQQEQWVFLLLMRIGLHTRAVSEQPTHSHKPATASPAPR
jgi:hypothetical protein